jgi:hypothetical protein
MKIANVQHITGHVAIEFDHGHEIVPTIINGKPIRYASIDTDGVIVGWSSLTPPAFDGVAWCLGTDDLQQAGIVGEDDGRSYVNAALSLRRVNAGALLVA